MIAKTEAIVLKSFNYRETSKIVTFFTKEYGRVSGVLKGIRKDHRKFGSNVDQFSVNDIVYYRYRNSDLHLVSQCDLKQFFFPIRQDLKKSLAASYVMELIYKVMPVEDKNDHVYRLILDFLESLETTKDVDQLVHFFQIKMLSLSGFRPHLDTCTRCKHVVHGKARFSMKAGGLICWECPTSDKEIHVISPGTINSILHIERHSWQNCLKLKMTKSAKEELKYVLNNFLVFHLGKNIKSAKYLHG